MYKLTTIICLLVVMAIGFGEEAPMNRNWRTTKKPGKIIRNDRPQERIRGYMPLVYGYITMPSPSPRIVKRRAWNPDEPSDDWRPNSPHIVWNQLMEKYNPVTWFTSWVSKKLFKYK